MWLAGSDPTGGWLGRALLLVAALGTALPVAAAPRRRVRPAAEAPATSLVIHQEPRPTSPRVGEIPVAARGLITSGRRQRIGRSVWHEVQYQGVRGWVNAPALPLAA